MRDLTDLKLQRSEKQLISSLMGARVSYYSMPVCNCKMEKRFNFLHPSRKQDDIFVFCFAKWIEQNCDCVDGYCKGCLSEVYDQDQHTGCPLFAVLGKNRIHVDLEEIMGSVNTLCIVHGIPRPPMDDFRLLERKCNGPWRTLVQKTLMYKFEMYPDVWRSFVYK